MPCGLFGFEPRKQVELDELIVEHGQRYVPDTSAGLLRFAGEMDGRMQADPDVCAHGAWTYTFIAHTRTRRCSPAWRTGRSRSSTDIFVLFLDRLVK